MNADHSIKDNVQLSIKQKTSTDKMHNEVIRTASFSICNHFHFSWRKEKPTRPTCE